MTDDVKSNNKCLECDGKGYPEILSGWHRPCDVCYGEGYLRQPQTDALKVAREALERIANRKWDTMTQGCDAASKAAQIAREALTALKEK